MASRGLAVFAMLAVTRSLVASEPSAETLRAWNLYAGLTEARIASELDRGDGFSALDFMPPPERASCQKRLAEAEVCVLKRETLTDEGKTIAVPGGMIHHWFGSILVPGVSVDRVLEFVQSYDDSARYYPEVEESRLLDRNGDVFEIYLRLERKKVMTVHYNTEHEVTYYRDGDRRASSKSIATRIREIDGAGEADEREKEPGTDRGFLWALRSYWRFHETEEGTFVECETVSLSRSVPAAAQWLVKDFIDSVPRESLRSTLGPIRDHLTR